MASLTYIFNEQARTIELEQPRMVVGRVPGCDIYINNRSVSRQHCVFLQKNGSIVVQDLGSANGTYVQGKKVTECILRNDDVVMLGDFKLWFKENGAAPPGKVALASPIPHEAQVAPSPQPVLSKPEPAPVAAPEPVAAAPMPVQAPAPVPEKPKPKPSFDESSSFEVRISADSQDIWFYAIKEQRLGPVDSPSLRRLAKDRIVSDDTLVWKEGLPDWVPAGKVKGLFDLPIPVVKAVEAPKPAPPVRPPAVAAPAREPLQERQEVAVSPSVTVPLGAPAAAPSQLEFDALQRKVISDVARYSLILGVLLLLGVLWQGYLIIQAYFFMRAHGTIPGKALFFGLTLLAVVTILCGVFSLRCASAFLKVASGDGDTLGNLTGALTKLERLFNVQCVWGFIVLAGSVASYFVWLSMQLP